jgi:CBS domain-containing protein
MSAKKKHPHLPVARDIMSTDLITVPLDCTLRGLAITLHENHVTGAPVVDDAGRLAGVVTQSDLVRHDMRQHGMPPRGLPIPGEAGEEGEEEARGIPSRFHTHLDEADFRALGSRFIEEDFGEATVADVFTPFAVTAPVDASLSFLATLMTERGIHRILIVEDARVVGIVTSMDVLRTLARPRAAAAVLARMAAL